MPSRQPAHRWTFTRRIRPNAFGWKASSLAIRRLKEAVREIRVVARTEPVAAGEGAVRLLERIWPALAAVDSSSGTLGKAVSRAVGEAVEIIRAARPTPDERDDWLERLFEAIQEDGVEYLWEVGMHWGELCGSAEVASLWAGRLLPLVRASWSDDAPGAWCAGAPACLSALLVAGRHEELFELLALPRRPMREFHRFGVLARAARGMVDEAIEFSEQARDEGSSGGHDPGLCEALLLEAGREEEAWLRYGRWMPRQTTYLALYRASVKRYPGLDADRVLRDLIEASPEVAGSWFATAVQLGELDLAAALIRRSATDHRTTLRAAGKHAETAPEFARDVALTTLEWLFDGICHEATTADVIEAIETAVRCAERLGEDPEETVARILELAGMREGGSPLGRAAVRFLGVDPGRHPPEPASRQGLRLVSSAAPAPEPGLGISVSRTVADFLEPVLDEIGDDAAARSAVLTVGMTVWNCVVLEVTGRGGQYLEDMLARVRGRPEAALVEMLLARKRELFAQHRWLIGGCEFFEANGGELRLRVEARSAGAEGGRGT